MQTFKEKTSLINLSDSELKKLTDDIVSERNKIAYTLLRACDEDSCYYISRQDEFDFDKLFAEHLKLNDYLQFTIAPEWQRRQVSN